MNRKPIEMKDFNKPKEIDQKFQNFTSEFK